MFGTPDSCNEVYLDKDLSLLSLELLYRCKHHIDSSPVNPTIALQLKKRLTTALLASSNNLESLLEYSSDNYIIGIVLYPLAVM